MKASFFLTAASLICLLAPQAFGKVISIKDVKSETLIIVENESLQILANEIPTGTLLQTLESIGVTNALTSNEREFRTIPALTNINKCITDKELETAKCEVKERTNPLFNEKDLFLVCTVTSVYRCEIEPLGERLDFNF